MQTWVFFLYKSLFFLTDPFPPLPLTGERERSPKISREPKEQKRTDPKGRRAQTSGGCPEEEEEGSLFQSPPYHLPFLLKEKKGEGKLESDCSPAHQNFLQSRLRAPALNRLRGMVFSNSRMPIVVPFFECFLVFFLSLFISGNPLCFL